MYVWYLLSAGVLFLNEAALPETDTISPLLLPEDSKLPLPSKQKNHKNIIANYKKSHDILSNIVGMAVSLPIIPHLQLT